MAGRRAGLVSLNTDKFFMIIDLTARNMSMTVMNIALNIVDKIVYEYNSDFYYEENLYIFMKNVKIYVLRHLDMAEAAGKPAWIPAVLGFLLGIAFLLLLDTLTPHLHLNAEEPEGRPCKICKSTMTILAITIHNIPEGMATGLAFALAAQHHNEPALFTSAFALAIGIGIQNFPEGAAIALPLRQEGMSRGRAFLCGSLSGIVEPIFGIMVTLVAYQIAAYMPWLLSFAAGAMLYVVVEELIPEAHLGEHSHQGTLGVMVGFLVMMILDVALG